MATEYWDNDDLDNAPGSANNWSTGVPDPADDAVFDDAYVPAGNGNMNGVTDQWNSIDVRNFSYNIGSLGTPYTQDTGALSELKWQGSGKGWFDVDAVNITTVIARGTNMASDALNIDPGTCTNAYHSRGRLNWVDGAVTNYYQSYVNSPGGDAICYVQSAAEITNIYQTAGRMVYQGTTGPTTAFIGGIATFEDGAVGTSLDVLAGGMCTYKASGHTIALARVRGTLDLFSAGVPITVTSCIVYSGGLIKAGANVTFTADPIVMGSGKVTGVDTIQTVAY